MNEYDHKQMAEDTPLQRLQNINYLIRNMYASELKKPFTGFSTSF